VEHHDGTSRAHERSIEPQSRTVTAPSRVIAESGIWPADVYHYGTQDYDFHRAQLTLEPAP
jgi:hypothetical protein